MALTHLHFGVIVFLPLFFSSYTAVNVSSVPPAVKTILDPKRRHDLVDEAFLEQKDVLLDMLEAKLKEVRDKKKKKGDNSNYSNNNDAVKCEPLIKNVDLNLNAHGISAIGEADVKLKFGNSGDGALNLDATGISNIGRTHVELGVGNGTVHIPGLNNIFIGPSFLKKPCETLNQSNITISTIDARPGYTEIKEIDGRKINNNKVNNTLSPLLNSLSNKVKLVDDKLNENNSQKEAQENIKSDSTGTSNVLPMTSVNANVVTSNTTML